MTKYRMIPKHTILWAAGCVAVLGLVSVSMVAFKQRDALPPLNGAAVATYDLSATAQELQQSFASMSNDPKTTTSDYIDYMSRIQHDCNNILQYKSALQRTGSSSEIMQLLNSSASLCADLTKLANDSKHIYSTAGPLLSASTRIKRYQTLPFIKNRIRSSHTAHVTTAITELSKLDASNNDDYQSSALPLLRQLQASMKGSQGLGYFPALQNLQNQLFAERQQYWMGYAGLASLQEALKSQLNNYCQAIGSQASSLKACGKPKN